VKEKLNTLPNLKNSLFDVHSNIKLALSSLNEDTISLSSSCFSHWTFLQPWSLESRLSDDLKTMQIIFAEPIYRVLGADIARRKKSLNVVSVENSTRSFWENRIKSLSDNTFYPLDKYINYTVISIDGSPVMVKNLLLNKTFIKIYLLVGCTSNLCTRESRYVRGPRHKTQHGTPILHLGQPPFILILPILQ
jgi:hypothetical protein